MNFCAGEGIDATGSRELAALYTAITSDISWQAGDAIEEAMLIVSAEAPHMILKTSAAWNEKMGYSAKQMFGHCLDHYVQADECSGAGDGIGSVRRSTLSASSPSTLALFYDAMRSGRCAHIVTKLVDSYGDAIQCSVHSYAVKGRIRVSIGLDFDPTDGRSSSSAVDSLDYSIR
jgi:hypothetical protein